MQVSSRRRRTLSGVLIVGLRESSLSRSVVALVVALTAPAERLTVHRSFARMRFRVYCSVACPLHAGDPLPRCIVTEEDFANRGKPF